MKKNKKIGVAAVVAGVLVAGALAYLFATEKGNKIRKKATLKGQKLINDLEKIVADHKSKQGKSEPV